MASKALAKQQEIEGEKRLTLIDIAQHVANLTEGLEYLPKEDEEGRNALQENLREFILTAGADKIDGIGWFVDLSEAEVAGLRKIKQDCDKKIKSKTKAVDRMYDLLLWAMLKMNITQIQGRLKTVTLCAGKLGDAEVTDGSKLPDEYWKVIPAQRVPDLEKIEQDLKAKKDVPGARLKQGQDYIQIR